MRGQSLCWKLSAVAGLCLLITGIQAQQNTAHATIEVATVKPHPASVMHNNFEFEGNRFELEDQPLLKLIAFAYSVNAKQIVGTAGWVETKHWDMKGTTNLTEDATFPQEQELIRQLLTERFGMKFHHEQREMPLYALQVVKGKPLLTPAANPDAQPLEYTEGHYGQPTENYTSSSMSYFLTVRQLLIDRPLVDQTGLTGRYDFKLTYSTGDAPSNDQDAPPPLFTAIKEQLGLKFEPMKTAVDVMVIDHIELPSEN